MRPESEKGGDLEGTVKPQRTEEENQTEISSSSTLSLWLQVWKQQGGLGLIPVR